MPEVTRKLLWRVGGKVPLNVYEGDRPMFQCHTPEDAARIVGLLNHELPTAEELGRAALGAHLTTASFPIQRLEIVGHAILDALTKNHS
jgi:hypothetical protein